MQSSDSELRRILRDIELNADKKERSKREIEYYSSEVEKANKELQYHRNEMAKYDNEHMHLLSLEKRRRDEIARDEKNNR